MARTIELRRHTANEGDTLTAEGVACAVAIGERLDGPYVLLVSSGAQRATQSAACFLAGFGGSVAGGLVVDEGFRSEREDRWREIYASTQRGDLEAFLIADFGFVQDEATRFLAALERVVSHTPEGGRSMIVGHSPMLEAAVWAATGELVPTVGKGDAVVLVHEAGSFRVAE